MLNIMTNCGLTGQPAQSYVARKVEELDVCAQGYRFLLFIGENSMIIFLAHIIACAGYREILLALGFENHLLFIIGGLVVGLFCPLILVPMTQIAVRYTTDLIYLISPVRPLKPLA